MYCRLFAPSHFHPSHLRSFAPAALSPFAPSKVSSSPLVILSEVEGSPNSAPDLSGS